MRRRDFLIGTSLAGLAGEAAAQPVPLGFRRALGPNGNAYGPISGGLNPTIDLNFISGAAAFTTGSMLDGRITFSRADVLANASYYDATGVLRYGPTNIMTQSQDQTAWTLTNTTATLASGTAPDGANTMNRIAETATTSTHYINRNITVVAGTVYTVSIYAKAAERQYLQINYDDGTNGAYATFDLTGGTITGALTAKGSGTAVGATITAIGNGIYRCSITASHGTTTGRMLVSLATTANPAVAPSYAGSTSNGLLVWGAQMEANSAPSPYVPTVGAALSGPRFDYDPVTHVLRGLLIEEARTNLAFPSADVSTLFTATATTMTAASGTAPDGANTMVRIAETATTAVHLAQKTATVTASAVYTFSLFAKTAQDQYLQLFYDDTGSNGLYATFDLTGGTITGAVTARGTGTATGASIASVGNGIYRCTITGVATSATSVRYGVNLAITAAPAFAPSYAGNASNGLLIWGAQFELGSIPTSYIPTVGASVTRTADIATMALVPPTSYTVAGECMVPVVGPSGSGVTQGIATIDDGTTANRTVLRLNNAFMQAVSIAASATTGNVILTGLSANTVMKSAYVSNGSASTLTLGFGGTLQTPVSGAQPTGLTTMRFGVGQPGALFLDGWLRRVRYYTSALSSAQLTQITT